MKPSSAAQSAACKNCPTIALLDGGVSEHLEDCDCDNCCTHEITEWGRCTGCGTESGEGARPALAGCQGRGWYHDGSEQEDAARTGRKPRPCPHHIQTHPYGDIDTTIKETK